MFVRRRLRWYFLRFWKVALLKFFCRFLAKFLYKYISHPIFFTADHRRSDMASIIVNMCVSKFVSLCHEYTIVWLCQGRSVALRPHHSAVQDHHHRNQTRKWYRLSFTFCQCWISYFEKFLKILTWLALLTYYQYYYSVVLLEYRVNATDLRLSGLESFSFDYVVKWPVSLVISRKVRLSVMTLTLTLTPWPWYLTS